MSTTTIPEDGLIEGVVPVEAPRYTPLERILQRIVEVPAAIIVLTEIVLLLTSVIFRFFLHNPIVWADELSGILFLWLGMLGSVLALQRSQHMRLTTIVSRVPPRMKAFLQTLAVAGPALLLILLMPHAIEYAYEESMISTPALGWSLGVRASAIPVGLGLMLIVSIIQLLKHNMRDIGMVVAAFAVVAGLLWLGAPVLQEMGHTSLILFFIVILLGGVVLGVPIAFAFGIATAAYLLTMTDAPLLVMTSRMDEGMSSLILLAVPLFVFLGALIEMTGLATAMVSFLASLLAHVRGGLNYVLLGAMYLVSGISGAKAADMAAVAPILFPEMRKRGADEGEMVSLLSASGAMSETIPPSIVLIAIGSVVGVSIKALFVGGLLPAVVMALALCVIAWFRARKEDMSQVKRPTGKMIGKAFLIALPALLLPVAIRFFVAEGVATATEVSTLAIAYGVVVGIIFYRKFDVKRLPKMLSDTAALSGAILLIIGAASAMAWSLTTSGFSRDLVEMMSNVPFGVFGFMVVSIVMFIILGSILEGIPAIVLFGPLLFPVARGLEINDVHYAMVVILAMGIGLFSPPFGVGYYSACAIGNVNPDAGLKKIWPYMGALIVGLIVVAAFPWISTGFLPSK
ncbi:TRAP transporter large permease subunit [Brevundimonas sp.]|jgi:tripartite ATP-independent transporter DctM subunit|uniref:TRAP transporter large permease subunit n=1 Tax=Brevundimonas sp. TaxID=1871086 RepID=UPI0037C0E390